MHDGRKVLDVHGHVSAPLSLYTPVLLMLAANSPMPSAVKTGPMPPILPYDISELEPAVDAHIRQLDKRRIDVQIVGPKPPMQFGWAPAHIIEASAALTNDLIDAQCRLVPDRFVGAAQLPQRPDAPDATHMLAELNRCVLDLGFVAAYVSPNPSGTRSAPGMHSRYWEPLYERAAHLDVPLIVHASANRDERSNDIFLGFQLDYQAEEYHAKQFVLRGRVFDRHPDLRMLICHCGGVLERYPAADPAHMVADDFVDNLFYDTCAYDTEFLSAAIRQIGPGRMCFGSEVPSAAGTTRDDAGRPSDDLVSKIDEFDWLDESEKAAIFHENPIRFCKALASLL